MPSRSAKQRRFMSIAAHNPKFAKEAGIDPAVAAEFHAADKALRKRKAAKRRHTTSTSSKESK